MKNPILVLIFTLFILSVIRNTANSDDRSNARGIAMTGATNASSWGIDAYGVNPANFDVSILSLNKKSVSKPAWEFSFMSLGGGYGSDSSLDFYENYLRYLSVNRETFTHLFTDIASVLEFRQTVLPGERTDVNYDFELKWLSVNYSHPKYGAVNFTITDRVGLNSEVLSRDEYLPLTFGLNFHSNGSYDMTNVELNQSEATAWWIRKYSLGYAKKINFNKKVSLALGFSAGLVHGFGNVITRDSYLDVSTYGIQSTSAGTHVDSIKGKQGFFTQSSLTDFFQDYIDGAESHYTFFPKPAGTGFSFDIGTALSIGKQWKMSFSVTDIGRISWDYNTITNNDTNSFNYSDFILSASDRTYNLFVNDLEGLDTRDTTSSYDTEMPTKYRAGICFSPTENFLIELDWSKGENNFPGNSKKDIVSVGTEFFLGEIVPVRAGLAFGGPDELNFGLGTGLRLENLTIDLSAANINRIWKQFIQNNRVAFSFSAKLII